VMTASGLHLRRLTDYEGRDESPDWQSIPAPETERRCGDLADTGSGARDVRAGEGLSCAKARKLAARWAASGQSSDRPGTVGRYDAEAEDFGGLWRVVLTHPAGRKDKTHGDKLVAFLFQP
jgi:hypothetical protein